MVASAHAELEVYEPFAYPAGALNGQSGTNEFGVTGAWDASPTALIGSNTLSYSSLPVTGRAIRGLSGSQNNYGGSRTLDPDGLLKTGLLADGAVLWFSLILGYDAGGNMTNSRLGFSLANNSFNQGNYNYWINDDGSLLGSGVGVTLGNVGGGNGQVVATQFQDLSAGDSIAGNVIGSWEGTTSRLGENEPALIVGKITWAATNDVIELYRPDTNLNLGPVISTLTVSVTQTNFDTLTWARGDKVMLDEIRFGGSYTNVLGAFDPPSGTVINLQ